MPHLRFRALDKKHVEKLSQSLVKDLAQIMATGEDNFSFEVIETQFFQNGKPISGDPFVEVLWFSRSQEIQDQSAKKITKGIQGFGPFPFVTVVFTALSEASYYENGVHF
jgi:hypothetical protein